MQDADTMAQVAVVDRVLSAFDEHRRDHAPALEGAPPPSTPPTENSCADYLNGVLRGVISLVTFIQEHTRAACQPGGTHAAPLKLVVRLCKLLRMCVDEDVCPHAAAAFNGGDPAHVAPFLGTLVAGFSCTGLSDGAEAMVDTASTLLRVVFRTNLARFRDLFVDVTALLEATLVLSAAQAPVDFATVTLPVAATTAPALAKDGAPPFEAPPMAFANEAGAQMASSCLAVLATRMLSFTGGAFLSNRRLMLPVARLLRVHLHADVAAAHPAAVVESLLRLATCVTAQQASPVMGQGVTLGLCFGLLAGDAGRQGASPGVQEWVCRAVEACLTGAPSGAAAHAPAARTFRAVVLPRVGAMLPLRPGVVSRVMSRLLSCALHHDLEATLAGSQSWLVPALGSPPLLAVLCDALPGVAAARVHSVAGAAATPPALAPGDTFAAVVHTTLTLAVKTGAGAGPDGAVEATALGALRLALAVVLPLHAALPAMGATSAALVQRAISCCEDALPLVAAGTHPATVDAVLACTSTVVRWRPWSQLGRLQACLRGFLGPRGASVASFAAPPACLEALLGVCCQCLGQLPPGPTPAGDVAAAAAVVVVAAAPAVGRVPAPGSGDLDAATLLRAIVSGLQHEAAAVRAASATALPTAMCHVASAVVMLACGTPQPVDAVAAGLRDAMRAVLPCFRVACDDADAGVRQAAFKALSVMGCVVASAAVAATEATPSLPSATPGGDGSDREDSGSAAASAGAGMESTPSAAPKKRSARRSPASARPAKRRTRSAPAAAAAGVARPVGLSPTGTAVTRCVACRNRPSACVSSIHVGVAAASSPALSVLVEFVVDVVRGVPTPAAGATAALCSAIHHCTALVATAAAQVVPLPLPPGVECDAVACLLAALEADGGATRGAAVSALTALMARFIQRRLPVPLSGVLGSPLLSGSGGGHRRALQGGDGDRGGMASAGGATASGRMTLLRSSSTEQSLAHAGRQSPASASARALFRYMRGRYLTMVQARQYAKADTLAHALAGLMWADAAPVDVWLASHGGEEGGGEAGGDNATSLTDLPSYRQAESVAFSPVVLLASGLHFFAARWCDTRSTAEPLGRALAVDAIHLASRRLGVPPEVLLRVTRDGVAPRLVPDLLAPGQDALLARFVDVVLAGRVSQRAFLLDALPAVLPVLFTTSGGLEAHLARLAFILRHDFPVSALQATQATQGVLLLEGAPSDGAGFEDLDDGVRRQLMEALVLPNLHHILGRLMLQLPSVDEPDATAKLLSTLTDTTEMSSMISYCFNSLVEVLLWQVGEDAEAEAAHTSAMSVTGLTVDVLEREASKLSLCEEALAVLAGVMLETKMLQRPAGMSATQLRSVRAALGLATEEVAATPPLAAPPTRKGKPKPKPKPKGGKRTRKGKAMTSPGAAQRRLVITSSAVIGLTQRGRGSPARAGRAGAAAAAAAAAAVDVLGDADAAALKRVPLQLLVEQHFLLLLFRLSTIVQNPREAAPHKLRALVCLERLVHHARRRIEEYVPPILSVLKLALQQPALTSAASVVWLKFLKLLSDDCIRTYLSSMVVSLMSVFSGDGGNAEDARAHVLNVLSYVLITKHDAVVANIKHIPCVPDVPALKDIAGVVAAQTAGLSLEERLAQLAELLDHDSDGVKRMALMEVLAVLHANTHRVQDMIAGHTSEAGSPVVNTLLAALLRVPRRRRERGIWLLVAQCLGELGAVDPRRVAIDVRLEQGEELGDVELMVEFVGTQLVAALRAAPNLGKQNNYAFAIQEVLKLLVAADGDVAATQARFTPEVWLIISPYLATEYYNTFKPVVPPPHPSAYVAFYPAATRVGEWVAAWAGFLISAIRPSRTSLWGACASVVRIDLSATLYLLPYLVRDALGSAGDAVPAAILAEVTAVLSDQEHGAPPGGVPAAAATSASTAAASATKGAGMRQIATQAVFALLDTLSAWDAAHKAAPSPTAWLLDAIPQRLMARAAFRCNAHARALRHLETAMRRDATQGAGGVLSGFMPGDVSFLQLVYSNLDEPDGLAGVASLRPNDTLVPILTLRERIIDCEHQGRWSEALVCFEQALQRVGLEPEAADGWADGDALQERDLQGGILRCLQQTGHLETALHRAFGVMARQPELTEVVTPYAVEAAWRLGRWDALDHLLPDGGGAAAAADAVATDYDTLLGGCLQCLQRGPAALPQFRAALDDTRINVMASLSAASMESYDRAYPFLVRLHSLRELELSTALFDARGTAAKLASVNDDMCWHGRYTMTAPSLRHRKPLLALRRVVYRLHGLEAQEAGEWLAVAKAARAAGHASTASDALLHAEALGAPAATLEHAKFLHSTGQVQRALQLLHVEKATVARLVAEGSDADRHLCARQVLLATNWMADSQVIGKEAVEWYTLVAQLRDKWEHGFFHLGRYYDKLLKAVTGGAAAPAAPGGLDAAAAATRDQYVLQVVKNFSAALQEGHKFIFESLPRMLTLWFNYGADVVLGGGNASVDTLVKLNGILRNLRDHMAGYKWMTALPQLASRICHRHPEVTTILTDILKSILWTYPQQSMWHIVGLANSKVPLRRVRAMDIISAIKKPSASKRSQLEVCDSLFQDLIRCAMKQPARGTRTYREALGDAGALSHAKLLVPLQAALTVTLPRRATGGDGEQYMGFPEDSAVIERFSATVTVMESKERPKKITAVDRTTRRHNFLCKMERKGDLRKDARMMEFNCMINRLLLRDGEGRRRKLRLRTYSVVCLNEECGLLEWVPNTSGFRSEVTKLFVDAGLPTPMALCRMYQHTFEALQKRHPTDHTRRAAEYAAEVAPHFPVMFHKWGLRRFRDPTAWFEGRLAFTRSAAVWGMVGHIVGLGDRHGDNILLDQTTGECVHVDFDCLFEKGLSLAIPEVVPFRLTPNMRDGLGLAGPEGVFRRVCEVTMRVLRDNKGMLMSVLESFIHDPLVEWRRKSRRHRHEAPADGLEDGAEVANADAKDLISRINQRLDGFYNNGAARARKLRGHRVSEEAPLPLSIEGQVHRLIREATSTENLSRMYVGWMPFL